MAKRDVASMRQRRRAFLGIMTDLTNAIREQGGTEEDIHRLATPDGKQTILEMAKLAVRNTSEVYELQVNYDDPRWKSIERDRYVHVGDVTVEDYPVPRTGIKTVRFRELAFDHNATDDEVLSRMAQLHCRQPNWAEAETAIRTRYTPEQFGQNPRVGLIGPAVRRSGNLFRAYVLGDEDGVFLDWYWARTPWCQHCRFVVVQN